MKKLINKLRSIHENQQELMEQQAPLLQKRVNKILEQRSTDVPRIDHLMDDLLMVVPHGYCVEDFKRLYRYLKTLDTKAADFYAEAFEEVTKNS